MVGIVDCKCQDNGHPLLSFKKIAFSSWRLQEMENEVVSYPTLAARRLGIIECSVIMKLAGIETWIMLPTFWTTFFIKFEAVAEIGLEQRMRAARETTFFITLRIENDRAATIIDECVVDSSFGKGLMVVTHVLKAAINEEIVVASSNNDLKATVHILRVPHGKVVIVVTISTA